MNIKITINIASIQLKKQISAQTAFKIQFISIDFIINYHKPSTNQTLEEK